MEILKIFLVIAKCRMLLPHKSLNKNFKKFFIFIQIANFSLICNALVEKIMKFQDNFLTQFECHIDTGRW